MNVYLLNEILILFGLAIGVVFLCHRLRVPRIVGFLLTGVLTGPHGLGWMKAVHEVEVLAEIGVVLLLFTIGIEFSFKNMLRIKKAVLLGGSVQVILTILAGMAIGSVAKLKLGPSVFIGFLLALSSTAIVISLLQERAEIDTPYGQTTLAILIFQDLVVVPMMLIIPLLGEGPPNVISSPILLIAKGIGIVVMVGLAAKWAVPYLLYQIARTGSRELFLLSVLVICFSVAWITSSIGLSLALGAFLAGLIISESEYSHQTLGNILPFKDVFTSFFFVSIGMLLDIRFFIQHPVLLVMGALGIMALKSILAGATAGLLGLPLRTLILVGLALGQIGEFSFLLVKTGAKYSLFSEDIYQSFLGTSILSMVLTPFLMAAGPRLVDMGFRMPIPKRWKYGLRDLEGDQVQDLTDHLIIVGFGVNGRNLARAARASGIPYVVIEMNPETVRKEKARGEPILYGDAVHGPVLLHANLLQARIVVVAINDPAATRSIVEVTRRLHPRVHLIVRTRYLSELKALYEIGADEVIPEEFETSVEIFTRVLKNYLVPRDEIERLTVEVRADTYEIFRQSPGDPTALCDLQGFIHDLEIVSQRIAPGSPLIGKSLAQLAMRKNHGVSVVAIRRDQEILVNPDPHIPFQENDILILLGASEKVAKVHPLFQPRAVQEASP